ncbi:hypothetical protein GW17_00037552, partial [Ensete ventricosum]
INWYHSSNPRRSCCDSAITPLVIYIVITVIVVVIFYHLPLPSPLSPLLQPTLLPSTVAALPCIIVLSLLLSPTRCHRCYLLLLFSLHCRLTHLLSQPLPTAPYVATSRALYRALLCHRDPHAAAFLSSLPLPPTIPQ